jgi:hypothetical protein
MLIALTTQKIRKSFQLLLRKDSGRGFAADDPDFSESAKDLAADARHVNRHLKRRVKRSRHTKRHVKRSRHSKRYV